MFSDVMEFVYHIRDLIFDIGFSIIGFFDMTLGEILGLGDTVNVLPGFLEEFASLSMAKILFGYGIGLYMSFALIRWLWGVLKG